MHAACSVGPRSCSVTIEPQGLHIRAHHHNGSTTEGRARSCRGRLGSLFPASAILLVCRYKDPLGCASWQWLETRAAGAKHPPERRQTLTTHAYP